MSIIYGRVPPLAPNGSVKPPIDQELTPILLETPVLVLILVSRVSIVANPNNTFSNLLPLSIHSLINTSNQSVSHSGMQADLIRRDVCTMQVRATVCTPNN